MIFRNYRKVVTEAEAKKWFAISRSWPVTSKVSSGVGDRDRSCLDPSRTVRDFYVTARINRSGNTGGCNLWRIPDPAVRRQQTGGGHLDHREFSYKSSR